LLALGSGEEQLWCLTGLLPLTRLAALAALSREERG
jgi:hypothetical protein